MHRAQLLLVTVLILGPWCLSIAQKASQPPPGTPLLNGFAKELAGEHIVYGSSHPYATEALLTRCLDGNNPISWQTDPVPEKPSGAQVTFAWLAGHSTGSSAADGRFHLSINGKRWFTFTTDKERRIWSWSVKGEHGATLAFDAKRLDPVHDLFGYMYLSVPVSDVPQGRPLTISVVGEAAGRRDWYMAFTYPLRDSISVQAQPALLKSPAGSLQLVDVMIESKELEYGVEITAPGQAPVKARVTLGLNRIQVPVKAVDKETPVTLTIVRPNGTRRTEVATLRPVTLRELWMLPHSHNDIGYSDLQADVERKQLKNIRDAIRLVRQTAGYPPEARFKWNTEIMWAVDRFLATCTEAERTEFLDAVRQGGIGLNALYSNQLTGICRPEELLRVTDFARQLEREYGLTIDDAMISDIPGYTWATVTALAQGGIKYFSSGPNYAPSLPDGGDRVGHFNRTWGDRPFYWVSPSGQEKVLFWTAGRGYSWFHGWIAGKVGPGIAPRLFDYMRELEERSYPYDMVQVRYTVNADNGPTDPELPDFVEAWNTQYESPRIVLATASQMFHEFERRWGKTLPSYAGDITPYWEDGALSTLRELGLARRCSERLVQAEALTCIIGGTAVPRGRFDEAWRNVHLFDEHTWGAWNSVSDPEDPFAVAQWKVKQAYALNLERQSLQLMADALPSDAAGRSVEVVNTASWPRTDLVVLAPGQSIAGDLVFDQDGAIAPSQRLSTGELAFVAREVPPLGARRYFVKAGIAEPSGSVRVGPSGISNSLLTVAFDTLTGTIRSITTAGGREFVEPNAPGVNQYLYVLGRNPADAKPGSVARIEIVEQGPVVGVVRIVMNAPGCTALATEVRIVEGVGRIDIRNTLERPKVREKESVHFAFPFHVPGGEFHLDAGWGVLRPTLDQLPGSCKDYLSSGRWLDLSNKEYGVTWTTVESPLVEIGAMTDERPAVKGYRAWRTAIPEGTTFYSYAMNNYWHTNYTADQEGTATTHYTVTPHTGFNPVDAYRRGVESSQPLIARTGSDATSPAGTLLAPSAPSIVVTSLMPSADGKAMMVRLFNASAAEQSFSVLWKRFVPTKVYLSSPAETNDVVAGDQLKLPAYGIVTLRCEK